MAFIFALMKYYLIAGEASGDLHASLLMKALLKNDPSAEFRYWGGNKMAAVGGTLAKHYKELAFMGFWEVITNLKTIFKNLSDCFEDIQSYQPDVLILVDYSGFNLRIAKKAKEAGMRVNYYISPQVWASRASRVHKIKAYVDDLFAILPFEKDFYAQYYYPVHYIGHPLLDVVKDFKINPNFHKENNLPDKKIIALLPGSRKQEIKMMLGKMMQVVKDYPNYQFLIAGAPSMSKSFYDDIINAYPKEVGQSVRLLKDCTYDIFARAEAALVTSGTATLEAALFRVPQVVCYKGSSISYAIAKRIIQVKYISLVNLIMDKEVVKELIQQEMNAAQLKVELSKILGENRQSLLETYEDLALKLGSEGAAQRAANIIVSKN